MTSTLERFRAFVFDCDGVILDSNELKTEAFRQVASRFGHEPAERLVAHHRLHGGVSRFEKFRWLAADVLGRPGDEAIVDELVEEYGRRVRRGLETCPECPGATEALALCSEIGPCFLVSGGLEEELRAVFRARGLDGRFRGIHGSPSSKSRIMAELRGRGEIASPTLFFGDSRIDAEVAEEYGCEFVFLHGRTEMPGWREWVRSRGLARAADLGEWIAGRSRGQFGQRGDPVDRARGVSGSKEEVA